MKEIICTDGQKITRCSGWIKIRTAQVTSRHQLADYADQDGHLDYFAHNGRLYAFGQFLPLSYPMFWDDQEGRRQYLSAYDSTTYYRPYLLEIDDACEYVRLYQTA